MRLQLLQPTAGLPQVPQNNHCMRRAAVDERRITSLLLTDDTKREADAIALLPLQRQAHGTCLRRLSALVIRDDGGGLKGRGRGGGIWL